MRILRLSLVLSLACLPLLISPKAFAADEADPLLVEAHLSAENWNPGQAGQLKLRLSLPEGYHGYEDQFRLQVLEPDGFILGVWKISPIHSFFDKFSKKTRQGFQGKAEVTAPIEAPGRFNKNYKSMKLELIYQACGESFCLFPTTKIIDIPISLSGASTESSIAESAGGAAAVASTKSPSGETAWLSADKITQILGESRALALFFVFLAGILTSFTPCIFPMIPITLAILGHHSEQRTRAQNFMLSVFYVLGIATTYSIMGVIAASSGAVFGASLGNPWILGVICVLFFTMALSMYGVYEIQVPALLRNGLGSKKSAPGYPGAYASGLIAGVVASPCVGPILVAILAYVATTGSKLYGFVLLFTYALGLGLIFLLLGVFTEFTRRLPRSGPWLNAVKFVLGSLMLGAFYYYLGLLIPERWHDGALGLGLVILGSIAGAFGPLRGPAGFAKIQKGLAQALLVLGIGYLALGVFDLRPLINRPVSDAPTATAKAWGTYSVEALAAAKAQGRPVIVDFWAEWCAACHELEDQTFHESRVENFSSQFVLLRFDATKDTTELRALKTQWKIQGLPTVLFINPKGVWLEGLTLTEFEKPAAFLSRMEKALN